MQLLVRLAAMISSALAVACTVTVGVQAAAVGVAWSRGMLTSDKVVRYAGVIYGLDPLALAPPEPSTEQQKAPETRETILQNRIDSTPRLVERNSAVARTADEIRGITLGLKRTREKYVVARSGFESLLEQLETDTADKSLREVQLTMELVHPKQAKDILRNMLVAPSENAGDDVMDDVVEIVKALPDDKLKKILAEFKTDEDRKLLHRILFEIGQLDDRSSQLTSSTP